MTCSTGPPNNSLDAPSLPTMPLPTAGTIATPTSTPEQSTMLRNSRPPGHHEGRCALAKKTDEALVGLLSEDGYGYSWGEALGHQLYDTIEIASFLGVHPESAGTAAQLAAAIAVWTWLRNDFSSQTPCFPFRFAGATIPISQSTRMAANHNFFLQKRSHLTRGS